MRRITTTLFGVVAIAVIIFTIIQAQNMGVPGMFNTFAILVIIVIVVSVIRAWLRP